MALDIRKSCSSLIILVRCFVVVVAAGCVGTHSVPQVTVSKRAQMHMGTLVTITVVSSDSSTGNVATQAGFDEIKRLEQLLSTWRSDSELSRVNAEAGRFPVKVSQETLDLVVRSLEMAQLTHGGFNIALGPAVEAWNVMDQQQIPNDKELQRLRPLVNWTHIRIDKEAGTIFLPHEGMRLDVGGIGKGYAADRAVEKMKQAGATGGVVALSGDIKTFGVLPDRKGFPVGIRHPRQEDSLLTLVELKEEAISTAGDYERFFERDGVRYHHILDPQTLLPARGCQSVTIIAKEGIVADGLDTGIFVLGPESGMALVERLSDVEAIIVDNEGKITVSSGLRHRLRVP
ncbi:MAG: FAD:protein FMN transferase [Candidatus Nitrospira kreftii]|uniref:FAD:protein FMN transferase n=1 Tax=Candidatus Nitrospira kreftii TaxID=2652173 RepID=A0A7S8FGF6_9BACT|nr:MAG: FAD:protein FMN transferase [Candidatus Nitrospira kreftii]